MGIVRDYALYAYLAARLININKCPRAMRGCNDTLSCAFFLFLFFFLFFFLSLRTDFKERRKTKRERREEGKQLTRALYTLFSPIVRYPLSLRL